MRRRSLCLLICLCGCALASPWSHHLPEEVRFSLERLGTDQSPEADFVRIATIQQALGDLKLHREAVDFLQSPQVQRLCPQYAPLLTYFQAMHYHALGYTPLAIHLVRRLEKEAGEIVYRGNSLRPALLDFLVRNGSEALERLRWIRALSAIATARQMPIELSHQLGRAYQEVGFWDKAIQTYRFTLSLPGARDRLDKGEYNRMKTLVAYHANPPNVISRSLPWLVSRIREALERGDVWALSSLQSRADFVIQYWGQERAHHPNPDPETFFLGLLQFSRNLEGAITVRWDPSPHEMSTDDEVYIKTTNWYADWLNAYFYFRKIFYPPRADIHGSWEWAGLYLGGK